MNIDAQSEGWIGDEYVRLYSSSDRNRIAEIYGFPQFLPGYQPWGSWGLDAFCLGKDERLYLVDWIPLHESFLRVRYSSVKDFEKDYARLHRSTPEYEFFQKEVHLVTPLVFGGNPKESPKMIDQMAHTAKYADSGIRRI